MSRLDHLDEALAHVAQADALASVVYGEGYEAWNGLNDGIKSNYLWALAMTIERCRESIRALADELAAEHKARMP